MNINEIANLATSTIKPNKNSAWNYLRNIIEDSAAEPDSREAQALASLYRYFLPLPGKVVKTPEDWCKKAIGQNDVRYYLNFLYSDGNRLMGCDGHRLHIFQTIKYKPGYYDLALEKIDDKGTYPNVERVIPKQKGREMNLSSITGGKVKMVDSKEAINVKGAWVNHKYFLEAIAGFNPEEKIRFYNRDAHSALKIEQGDKLAVVMPMRI